MTALRPSGPGTVVPVRELDEPRGLFARAPATVVLAVVGALDIVVAVYSWSRWLASGPAPVTAHRVSGDASWWTARVYEGLIAVATVTLLIHLVRACRRERRLVFDAVFVIAGFFLLFWDPMVNWMQPNFMYSSQWLNLNTWVGQTPFVVNPTGGTMPQPVFIMFVYPFGLLGFAMIVNAGMRLARRVRPSLSNPAMVVVAYVVGGVMGMVLEIPPFLANLWALPGAPATLSLFDNDHRFPWAEYLTTAIVFATLACMRYFRNDKGETLAERGLDRLRRPRRTMISILVTTAVFALSIWALLLVQIPAGLHASPYPQGYPAHLISDLCDVHADQHTPYGPCPGSPGFRMPVKETPGPSTP